MAIIDDKTLEELKNNKYEFAEIIGVEYEGKSSYIVCKCICGNTFKKKLYQMKNLTIHCGCKKSLLLSRAFYKKVEEDPAFLKRRGESYSKWCKNNPDKVKEYGINHSKKLKENYENLIERGRQHTQWYKDNNDKLNELNNKKSQWFKNNPEKVKQRSIKYSQWCKDNPDKVKEKANKYSQWCKDNPDKNNARSKSIENVKKIDRINKFSEFTNDELSKIHQDDIISILNGDLCGASLIRIKCPCCNNYDYHRFDQSISLEHKCVIQRQCSKCMNEHKSHYEDEIYNYIISLGCSCIRNDRSIIDGKELDLYIPDKKVAVEFNGTYWHSTLNKEKYYHYDKFIACLNKGIRLISVYEYDYNSPTKRDKILQIIKYAITDSKHVYARKCKLLSISQKDANDFFNNYHLDGSSRQCNICYGLYYNNALISVIAFGKLRSQNKLRNKQGCYELVRYACLPDITIIGGMSRLFKHFINDYNPNYILCYSDNDCFNGFTYANIGFKLNTRGKKAIDYNWVKKEESLLRQQCMPCRLLKKFPQYKNIQITGSVEKYIMEDLGYIRIYRCGNSKWEWFNN